MILMPILKNFTDLSTSKDNWNSLKT